MSTCEDKLNYLSNQFTTANKPISLFVDNNTKKLNVATGGSDFAYSSFSISMLRTIIYSIQLSHNTIIDKINALDPSGGSDTTMDSISDDLQEIKTFLGLA